MLALALFVCLAANAQNESASHRSGRMKPNAAAKNGKDAKRTPATPAEDLSSVSLGTSHLVPEKPVLGEKDNLTTFSRELVGVQWRPGDGIHLYVILPKGVRNPPAILYLYSFPSETDRFLNTEFCKFLTKGGVAAIGFVSALTGQRYHDRPMREWFVSELRESLVTSAHDVQMILNYLSSRGDIDVSHIGMFGAGSGGAIAVLSAAVDKRIKAVDLVDPWGDWPHWLAKSRVVPENERPNYVKADFLKKVAPFDPVHWLPRLKIPVRLQYLTPEGATPEVAQRSVLAARPPQAQVIPTQKGLAEYRATLGQKFFDWIKEQVRIPSNAPASAESRTVKAKSAQL